MQLAPFVLARVFTIPFYPTENRLANLFSSRNTERGRAIKLHSTKQKYTRA